MVRDHGLVASLGCRANSGSPGLWEVLCATESREVPRKALQQAY